MANMDRVMELNFKSSDEECYFDESYDWTLPHVFNSSRHTEKIEGSEVPPQGWRMKERMKTVSVALVLCLNVGVDPPGLIKLQPCARFECWVDPLSLSPQKALEQIGQNLQKQYERWQPRARYKQSLDPTVDEVKKLCVSLRRNAKEERVLFHYNGHGVPSPTTNGEIWVFNRNYTQYIPLSVYDLQTWMGYPSIYVYDCNKAGIIIKSFHQFAEQHTREHEVDPPNYSSCIQLAACSDNQTLPMNPDLPADLFTACLTTPIRMALRWFVLQNQNTHKSNKLLPDYITLDIVEKVPGQLNDRRTMLGELNWIFTAITDTIAWNTLPRNLFQKLFRQDLLVASLFRNYLLAERIMRSYDCTPVSSPKLPSTCNHPMWHAWDYALDQCLSQLRKTEVEVVHTPSPFFEEQLTAFEVWLTLGNEKRSPPEQLPIVLQVLLSQVHRVRALELLGKFLDLGWWAVNLALSVGIFPYVLKLLQSSAKELRPLLVFIWAKILAVDQTCQTDLVRDGSHKYFVSMIGDTTLPYEYRTAAIFVLSNIVYNNASGQQAALQSNSISSCLCVLEETTSSQLDSAVSNMHKWVCVCLGLTWQDYPAARWCGVRDSAHEKICDILQNSDPEVRAAGVFALGCFINGIEKTEHSNNIDHSVILMILNKIAEHECSPIVRQEIVVALHNFVLVFENHFVALVEKNMQSELSSPMNMRRISNNSARMRAYAAAGNVNLTITGGESYCSSTSDSIRRVASSSSLSNLATMFVPPSPPSSMSNTGGIYTRVYTTLVNYERDAYPGVSILCSRIIEYLKSKVLQKTGKREPDPVDPPKTPKTITPIVGTRYISWCWTQYSHPTNQLVDPSDAHTHTNSWVYARNAGVRKDCFKRVKNFPGKLEEQLCSKNIHEVVKRNAILKFHPYENIVAIAGGCADHGNQSAIAIFEYDDWSSTQSPTVSPRLLSRSELTDSVSSIEWLNPQDSIYSSSSSLLAVSSEDSYVRVYKPGESTHTLVTAWSVNNCVRNRSILLKYNEEFHDLITVFHGTNHTNVHVWDLNTETLTRDFYNEKSHVLEFFVNAIHTHRCEPHLFVVGGEDGSVRLLDMRAPVNDCVVTNWRDFNSGVINVKMRYDRNVVAGCSSGVVKFFDLRSKAPTKTIDTNLDVACIDIHANLPYFAVGTNSVNVYGFHGQTAFLSNCIREGFGGFGRIGSNNSISSLGFHPFKPLVSFIDSYSHFSIYKAKK